MLGLSQPKTTIFLGALLEFKIPLLSFFTTQIQPSQSIEGEAFWA
jgi:hypothetical protein